MDGGIITPTTTRAYRPYILVTTLASKTPNQSFSPSARPLLYYSLVERAVQVGAIHHSTGYDGLWVDLGSR